MTNGTLPQFGTHAVDNGYRCCLARPKIATEGRAVVEVAANGRCGWGRSGHVGHRLPAATTRSQGGFALSKYGELAKSENFSIWPVGTFRGIMPP